MHLLARYHPLPCICRWMQTASRLAGQRDIHDTATHLSTRFLCISPIVFNREYLERVQYNSVLPDLSRHCAAKYHLDCSHGLVLNSEVACLRLHNSLDMPVVDQVSTAEGDILRSDLGTSLSSTARRYSSHQCCRDENWILQEGPD